MCYLDPKSTTLVKDTITSLVRRKKRFTGYDVAVAAVTAAATCRDISTYVRELFNAHDACFNGYACYPVPGGPLLYFYAGAEVIRKGQGILDRIEAAAPTAL